MNKLILFLARQTNKRLTQMRREEAPLVTGKTAISCAFNNCFVLKNDKKNTTKVQH